MSAKVVSDSCDVTESLGLCGIDVAFKFKIKKSSM